MLWGNKAQAPQLRKPMYSRVHDSQLLSPHAATTKAHVSTCVPVSTTKGAATTRSPHTTTREHPLLSATRESPQAAMKTSTI